MQATLTSADYDPFGPSTLGKAEGLGLKGPYSPMSHPLTPPPSSASQSPSPSTVSPLASSGDLSRCVATRTPEPTYDRNSGVDVRSTSVATLGQAEPSILQAGSSRVDLSPGNDA